MIIGYTTGVFDMFHIGHLNIFKRAKEKCDWLIVGVTTDELVHQAKGKLPVIPFSERIQIVEAVRYVDQVMAQSNQDKRVAWQELRYDRLFVGSDWKGNPSWANYEKDFSKVGVEVIYFPYTTHTSSTRLRSIVEKLGQDL
jgi:glycerol-3-phosphate cytidylyltransferase